jgi:hypothetical protein
MSTERPTWHPGDEYADDITNDWQKEPDICRALELAAAEQYYAGYCGYDKLLLAAKAEIERLTNDVAELRAGIADM